MQFSPPAKPNKQDKPMKFIPNIISINQFSMLKKCQLRNKHSYYQVSTYTEGGHIDNMVYHERIYLVFQLYNH